MGLPPPSGATVIARAVAGPLLLSAKEFHNIVSKEFCGGLGGFLGGKGILHLSRTIGSLSKSRMASLSL